MLESAPSLSIYANKTVVDDGVELEDDVKMDRAVVGSGDFSFMNPDMDFIKEDGDNDDDDDESSETAVAVVLENLGTEEQMETATNPSMYLHLAAGLGIKDDSVDFKEGIEYSEEYYRDLLQQYPNHPLILKNYAHLLKRKGDLEAAEEYYLRATKADPGDGEILSQYAVLVWELHRDQERAMTYFELSAQTASKDSNVLAAYAKFLWEIDDDGVDHSILPDHAQEDPQKPIQLNSTDGNGVGIVGLAGGNDGPIFESGVPMDSADVENYYRRMTEENPSDPLFQRKYAQFLYQSKRDPHGAEKYYSQVVLAYPQDGEILSQYATLLWELYHDQKKTLNYMDQAIEAAPQDSNVLAAYARFLWTIDDDEF